MFEEPRFLSAGDRAMVVELGDEIDPATNARTRALALAIDGRRIDGVVETVPTYRSVLVYVDPLRVSMAALVGSIRDLARHLEEVELPSPRIVEIPTVYGGAYGPDLQDVAAHTGLTPDDIVAIHSGTDYLVYMMGFITGFPYLGGLSETLAMPRLPTPRTAVPAGSIGIALQQTGIYPVETPGGWRLVGRTPVRWFDATREPPVPVEAGDYIRFVPVSVAEYEDLRIRVQAGTFRLVARAREAAC
jgi:inhibitor of KinA